MTKKPHFTDNPPDIFKIAITLLPDIGPVLAKRLIAYTGSAKAVFHESQSALAKIPGIGKHLLKQLKTANIMDKAEKECRFIKKYDINVCDYLDPGYPKRLKQCEDGPVLFYYKGTPCWQSEKVIAMVGTRNATDYGKNFCEKFVESLKERHPESVIISGLAYGIDIASHRAAIKHHLNTLAVLGHGFNTLYPAVHTKAAKEIVNQGALITEFNSDAGPDRNNFVRRNRIIAGLADAIIVVESAGTGGALITADIANSYNREVFAVPGRTTDAYSTGCNKLIRQNKAALLESVEDLEYLTGWDLSDKGEPKQQTISFDLTQDEEKIASVLRGQIAVPLDIITMKTGMPVSSFINLSRPFN
ncbi:MAG: DNA-processing protein DprA, partial [Bacteroidota bacterium]